MTKLIDLLNHVRNLINPLETNSEGIVIRNEKRYGTSYLPITDHIYFDGHTFRVRFSKEGIKYTKNFKTRKLAIKYKKKHVK